MASDTGSIACPGTCTGCYYEGDTVTLNPTAGSGWKFIGWSGDADCEDGVVAMTTDVSCAAEFYNFPWPMFLPAITSRANP